MAVRKCLLVGLAGLAATLVHAQQGRIAGPVAGYVFDSPAHALRPILGIPGASVLGDAVKLGIDPVLAAVSPKLDSVIAVAGDRSFHFFRLNAGVTAEASVNGLAASPERIVFSPAGTAAALYAGGQIQILTGLPGTPTPGNRFELTALLALPGGRGHGPFTAAFAVSDDGAYLLVAAGNGVQLFGSAGIRQLAATRSTAVAFAPGSHDAVLAGTSVILVKDTGGASTLQPVGDSAHGAVGAAFSADAGTVYIASSEGVAAFDLAAGTRTLIHCNCTPESLTGMGNVYRLNEAGPAPLWLLDPNAATPRIVFVPVKASL